jgi:hypothetical protein
MLPRDWNYHLIAHLHPKQGKYNIHSKYCVYLKVKALSLFKTVSLNYRMKMGSIRIILNNNLFKNVSKCTAGYIRINMRFPLNCRSKTGRIKSEFRHDICALNTDVDLDTAGPIVLASTVLGYNGERHVNVSVLHSSLYNNF